jgi:putative endonuclease
MSYFVYILKSKKNGKRYIGFTSKDVEIRLLEHNQGNTTWTRNNGPFVLLKFEEYLIKQEALKREIFLKSGQGRKYLDSLYK